MISGRSSVDQAATSRSMPKVNPSIDSNGAGAATSHVAPTQSTPAAEDPGANSPMAASRSRPVTSTWPYWLV